VKRLGELQAAELARLIKALAPATHDDDAVSSATYEAHVSRALHSPNRYVFLAAADKPVGYVSAYRIPRLDHASDQVYIFDIEVAGAVRRRGVGRRLMEALLTTCWAEGVTWAWAGTARENVAAQRLFAAVGGQRVSETYLEYHFSQKIEAVKAAERLVRPQRGTR
jgi:ribosomal protein S18 acetylase RimI-like enzyme